MGKNNLKQSLKIRSGNFVFKYDSGFEQEVMCTLLDMIFNEDISFDWSDALIVSFAVIDELIKERTVYN